MKNAMKKIMSLVLVAMILVSALPVAASAAGYDVVIAGTPVGVYETITYEEALELSGIDTSVYDVTAVYNIHDGAQGNSFVPGQTLNLDEIGNIVYIWYETEEKATNDDENDTPATPTAYPMSIDVDGEMKVLTDRVSITYEEVLQMIGLKAADIDYIVYEGPAVSGTQMLDAGDKIDLAGETRIFVFTEPKNKPENNNRPGRPGNDNENNNRPGRPGNDNENNNRPGNNDHNRPGRDDDEGYGKFSNEVWLYIYTGTTIGEPNKRVLITDGIAADGKVTLNEVKSVVKYYYNAVDADTGITYDGIYPMQGGWVDAYIKDRKYNTVDGLYQAAAKQTVILRVMIGNAKLATTTSAGSNADNSNPKTGDQISMAITTMAVSASVLALGFYFTKKRAY